MTQTPNTESGAKKSRVRAWGKQRDHGKSRLGGKQLPDVKGGAHHQGKRGASRKRLEAKGDWLSNDQETQCEDAGDATELTKEKARQKKGRTPLLHRESRRGQRKREKRASPNTYEVQGWNPSHRD